MPTPAPELARAQAIVAAGVNLLDLIAQDTAARQGAGGAVSIASTLEAMVTHSLAQYAAAFGLAYGGPTTPQPAQPTGGE